MIIALQTLIFFRESLIGVINHFLSSYYKKFSLQIKSNESSDDEDSDDHVFSEYDEEKGVVFYPPVYAQRYAAVSDCLMDDRWSGELEKVVDFGYHDMSFIKYLIDVPGVKNILGVDLEAIPFHCSSDLLACQTYTLKRENPLQITLFQGNAADPDFRLIGCDAVIAIEMIEHMLPHDLERLIHTVFGFVKPQVAIFTTPNGDFNVLFKSLEKNGLRRLDHFFEWSREQYHDWCSNIVTRYPQYTVTTKGVGPGPTGTSHLGCCSQLAMFVAKDYHKQQDLDLNSFSLVPIATKKVMSDMVCSWNSSEDLENKMLCVEDNVESFTELLDNHSCMTIILTTPSYSLQSLEYQDKILQCNLDIEFGKNFLFDDNTYYNVLMPSRQKYARVYEIEDIASRLNCSTLQVKKFSKVTQNLLAKNKSGSFVHTREIVDEIKNLTKMLNFNNDSKKDGIENLTWSNINWGENAPYWNQFYKIVREYNYPYETKSDDCRILDLISEEINRLVDNENVEEFVEDSHKLEIPISCLMGVVKHITSDEDKVKDLLEWNGYEIVNDVLVHSRLAIDNMNVSIDTEDEWPDDAMSDLDATDARSTTISDRSNVPDYYGRTLRRALDRKVRNLRLLLHADEDITTELDRVVCRLMKFALNMSRGCHMPPPALWMQYKLLDLLTLTEKAIERRRRHILHGYSLKAIEYCKEASKKDLILTLNKIKEDEAAENIMFKYHDLVPSLEHLNEVNKTKDIQELNYQFDDSDFDDVTSNEFKENSNVVTGETNDNQIVPVHTLQHSIINGIAALPDWDSSNLDLVPYQSHTDLSDLISSDETNYSMTSSRNDNNKKNYKIFKYEPDVKRNNASLKITIGSQNKVLSEKLKSNRRIGSKNSSSKTKLVKKVYKKSSYSKSFKYLKMEYNHKAKERKKNNDYQMLQPAVSKPIPGNLLELYYPNIEVDKNLEQSDFTILPVASVIPIQDSDSKIADTEISVFLNLITEFGEETIALQRSIGTDPDADMIFFENEILLESVTNVTNDDSFCYFKAKLDIEDFESQSIFLYDINEPSTSKGVRHLSTDVQCGPDVSITNMMLSTSTSFTKNPKCYTKGIKIGDSLTDIPVHNRTFDFGTCTENSESVTLLKKSVGIKIKDSDMYIGKYERSTMTQDKGDNVHTVIPTTNIKETKSQKRTKDLKTDESGSKGFGSLACVPKLPTRFVRSTLNKSDFQNNLTSDHKNIAQIFQRKYMKPILSCGGIHVHSFKDRLVSEDLVYQGEWQRSKTKTLSKKYPNEQLIKRNKKLNITVKQNTFSKDVIKNDIKKVMHGPIAVRKPTQFSNKTDTKKLITSKTKLLMKSNKNEVKVASKKAMSSAISNNTKSIYCARRPVSASTPIRTNINIDKPRSNMKNYIPLYLRKKIKSLIMGEQTKEKNNHNKNKRNTDLQSLNVKELTKDLLKLSDVPHTNISYLVFRNEINTNKSIGTHSPPLDLIRNSSKKRSYSPVSQHSSTCSSRNSVATVRAASTRTKPIYNRKNATSSDRSNSGTLDIEAKCLKNKKYTRRLKINKKHPNTIALNDKENLPESSRNTVCTKDNEKNAKKVFVSRTKSVYMAQMTDSSNLGSLPVISKSKTHLNQPFTDLAIKSPNSEKMPASVSSISIKKSSEKNVIDEVIQKQKIPEIDDLLLLSQSATENTNSQSLDNIKQPAHQTKSSIISAIRQLVEDKLNVVENNYSDGHLSDSETVILSREDYNTSFEDGLSPINNNTAPINEDTYSFESDMDNNLINNPDIVNRIESKYASSNIPSLDVEQDWHSFKSIASVSTSKFSEYYLADNELDNNILSFPESVNVTSLEDIFERKDTNIMPNVAGLLAIQAFSGFSMNMEPIAGDQSDLVNLIDSETGSVTLDSARQTASEELFVSGRSSDTYESCLYDEEADVPHWLFNIISQQQSIEESEAEDALPFMVSVTDQEYDVNGNREPSVGVGAGAGDGRGIHSDHSQDSSGRGTSLSSSATSTGPQSEAVLVDSSAPMAHSVYGSIPGTNTQNETTGVSVRLTAANRNEGPNRLNGVARGPVNSSLLTSDVDADVSSLDTDVVDSDN